MTPDLPATPDATFWSEADQVYVSVHTGPERFAVWDDYRAGLQACYADLGVSHIVEDHLVQPDECSLVWLIRDREWQVVGGARAVGPFTSGAAVSGVPAMTEMSNGSSLASFTPQLETLIDGGGVVELKGGWTKRSVRGLGTVVGCFGWFCTWWFGIEHALATAGSENNLRRWEETGAVRFDAVEPLVGYPGPAYDTEPMVWSRQNFDRIPDRHRDFLWSARRQLHPARARFHGSTETAEVVHDPARVEYLKAQGVQMTDATAAMAEQAAELHPPLEPSDSVGWPWIHFPWRNAAVRVLGEQDFHRVRTDRNRHKLTDGEMAALRTKTVSVVGMSVGSAMAHTMAQEGLCGRMRIADHDDLELANLNRLSASLLDLGENKAQLAARRIAELDPYLELVVEPDGVHLDNIDSFLADADLVIEECDSLDIKVLVRERAAALGVAVVMETNDRGLLDIERFDLDPNRPLFHGLVDVPDSSALAALATEDKVPFILDILDAAQISARTAASMVEIDRTVSSWPQLGSEVALGAALACQAVKAVLLGRGPQRSGRVRVDLAQLVGELEDPRPAAESDPVPVATRAPLSTEFARAIHEAAELAPSGGNAQPWRFRLTEDRFEVHEQPDGLAMDCQARGTAVAGGAALFNAACIAAAHGRLARGRMEVDTSLHLDEPRRLGAVMLGAGTDAVLSELSSAIVGRVTNRRLDPNPTPLDEATVQILSAACATSACRLVHVRGSELNELAEVWAESDRLRFLTERLHREMFEELKDPSVDSVEVGLDDRTLELSAGDRAKLGILRRGDVMRELDELGGGAALRTDILRRLDGSSGLLVVVAPGSDRAAHVAGGMAMQRMWLEATRRSVGLQPVSPIFGYAHDDADFVELLGTDRASEGRALQAEAWRLLGIEAGESFVLSLRAHHGPEATAISDRRAHSRREPEVAPTNS